MTTSPRPPAPRFTSTRRAGAPQAATHSQGRAQVWDETHHGCFFGEVLEALNAIARAVNASNDPSLMVRKVAAALQPWLDFDRLMLSSIEGTRLRVIASNDPTRPVETLIDLSDQFDHVLWPILHGESTFDGPLTGSCFPPHNDAPSLTFINVPLAVEGQVYGVLHLDSRALRAWDEREVRLAALVGQQFSATWHGVLNLHRARQREAELAQALALLDATQEAAAEGICLVNTRGELVSYNRRFAALWNIAPNEAKGLEREARLMTRVLEQLADPDEFIAKIGELYDNPHSRARDEVKLRDGRIFERYSAPAIAPAPEGVGDAGGTNFGRVWTFSDISDRKRYQAQLEHQAFHDALTGLPNRVLLTQRLERALAKLERSRRALAVLFLDLDRFKIINDSLGHEKGDVLLRQVAARLEECLRPGDTAARFGGDEFVILLEEVSAPEDAVAVARRVAQALQRPFALDDHEVAVTSSVGIVMCHTATEAPDELFRKADIAMYRAKNSGKAQFHLWSEDVSHTTLDRLQLELELQGALRRDELEVWYQPIIDLSAGQSLAAYEALVRWRHPVRGLISPGEFIPIAEESGLIAALDAFVLRRACAQLSRWNAALVPGQTPLAVHVNLSARGFERPDVAELVARVLHEWALPAAQLVLEITESAIMLDTGSAIAQLHQLKQLGVGLAIDDFGTGHSSLAYLEFLPVDSFKIDRAFVARLAEGTAIVDAIVSLSRALRVEVVAEGVENARQMEQLRALGCRWAQGFWFSQPLPADQAQSLRNSFESGNKSAA